MPFGASQGAHQAVRWGVCLFLLTLTKYFPQQLFIRILHSIRIHIRLAELCIALKMERICLGLIDLARRRPLFIWLTLLVHDCRRAKVLHKKKLNNSRRHIPSEPKNLLKRAVNERSIIESSCRHQLRRIPQALIQKCLVSPKTDREFMHIDITVHVSSFFHIRVSPLR